MYAMSIIVVVLGALVLVAGVAATIIHARLEARYRKITEEEGLTWDVGKLDSAIDQIRAKRAELRVAGKEGTPEWVELTAEFAKVSDFSWGLGLLGRYFKVANSLYIVLGIALILVGLAL